MGELFSARVFILGAGFSAGAGLPLTNVLLPQAARLFRRECPGIYSRVEGYAKEVGLDLAAPLDATEFAKLCTHLEFHELQEYAGGERWSDEGSREKLSLKFYLSKAIALSTPADAEIPAHYIEFCRLLNPYDIVVTFNWDCLLERAMRFAGVSYSYSFQEGKVQICKLHGSINRIGKPPTHIGQQRNTLNYEPLGINGGLVEDDIWATNKLMESSAWLPLQPFSEAKPNLVLPGYGKAFDVRGLCYYWYRPGFIFMRRGGLYIIGLGLSDDDFIVESFLRHVLPITLNDDKKTVLVNPDPASAERFQFALGNGYGEHWEEKFGAETVRKIGAEQA